MTTSDQALEAVRQGAEMIRLGTQLRNRGIVEARDLGSKWRDIAAAADLTEHGAIGIYKRAAAVDEDARS